MKQSTFNSLTSHQKQVLNWYNDYRNNFLTVQRFAEYYGFTVEFATAIIDQAKHLHNELGDS
jgi:hypothetical protein